ncbi:MAG: calcium-binding protein [Proteobacteria bacterium]|nr:calcium-binding protein [Pseudomonadota bacterium]
MTITFNYSAGQPNHDWLLALFDAAKNGTFAAATGGGTAIVISHNGFEVHLAGTGLDKSGTEGNQLASGNVTGLSIYDGSDLVLAITGLTTGAEGINELIDHAQTLSANPEDEGQYSLLDYIYGLGLFDEAISATGSNDGEEIYGSSYADTLNGGDGDDYIETQGNADDPGNPDVVNGGDGIDFLNLKPGQNSGVTVNWIDGEVRDSNTSDLLVQFSNIEQIQLTGHNDIFNGAGGNDVVRAREGDDQLNGGDGDDYLEPGAGTDTIDGGDGWDKIGYAFNGNNGGDGITVTFTGGGNGWVIDTFEDTDTFSGIEAVKGSQYNDVFNGDEDNNYFEGMAGDDTFYGNGGLDTVSYEWEHERGGSQGILVDLALGGAWDTFGDDDVLVGIKSIRGSIYGDLISGDDDHNELFGLDGDDTVEGRGGDDFITLGGGTDHADGGTGWDKLSYVDDTGSNGIIVDVGDGTVTDTEGNTDTFNDIEAFQGSQNDDIFNGDVFDNWFEGMDGSDTYFGGGGRDAVSYEWEHVVGGTSGVVIDLSSVDDNGFATGTDTYGNTDYFKAISDIIGSVYGDTITGNGSSNLIRGFGGEDTIHGGGGHDEVRGDDGDDYVYGDDGNDKVRGGTGNDHVYGGEGNDNISGGLGDDVVDAGAGHDWINGEGGTDTLDGGSGYDVLNYEKDFDPEFSANYDGDGVTVTLTDTGLGSGTVTGFYETEINGDPASVNTTFENLEQIIGTWRDDVFNATIGGFENTDDAQRSFGSYGVFAFVGGDGADTFNIHIDLVLIDYSEEVWRHQGFDGSHQWGEADNENGVVVNLSGTMQEGVADGHARDTFGNLDVLNITGAISFRLTDADDIVWAGGTDTYAEGMFGNDIFHGGSGNDLFEGSEGNDTMYGGNGDDEFNGGDDNDTFHGGNGNDTAYGESGNDVLNGDTGNDDLRGDDGDDEIHGGAGRDRIDGGADNDTLYGDAGNDRLRGGDGNDIAYGGEDDDTVEGHDGNDNIFGGNGTDDLRGNNDNDRISGGQGSDKIDGGDGDDVLSGDDTLNLNEIIDYVNDAGAGDDAAYARFEALWDGIDSVGAGADLIFGGIGNDIIFGGQGADEIYGEDGADRLFGGLGDDQVFGGNNDDFISGSGGNDRLFGEGGTDTLNAGSGDDFADGGEGNDTIIGRSGNDWLDGGNGNDTLYGDDPNDLSASGNDTLNGGAGADRLEGGFGKDKLYGGLDDDVYVWKAAYNDGNEDTISDSGGIDTLETDISGINLLTNTRISAVENITLVNNAANATGNNNNNVLTGNNAANTLTGLAGNDTLIGGAGTDTLNGGQGKDTLNGGANSDRFVFAVGDSAFNNFDVITGYTKGAVNTVGDKFDFGATALVRGGTAAAATASQASINQTSGVATFASGSGTTMTDCVNDIAARINAGGTKAGEFAFFKINKAGSYYLFISDGVNGASANDVVIQLSGVTAISTLNLTGGDLTILT